MRTVGCDVEIGVAENDYGGETPVVYAECPNSGERVGPIWGDGPRSIRRALATLAGECRCGCFHQERKKRH